MYIISSFITCTCSTKWPGLYLHGLVRRVGGGGELARLFPLFPHPNINFSDTQATGSTDRSVHYTSKDIIFLVSCPGTKHNAIIYILVRFYTPSQEKWSLWAGWLIAAKAWPGFCSMAGLGIFLLHLDGMLVHSQVTPCKFLGFSNNLPVIYSRVERGTVRV